MSNIKKIFNYLLNLEFYTSPLDLFLEKFRKEHPKLSDSQRREQQKHADIHHQAGHNVPADANQNQIWKHF